MFSSFEVNLGYQLKKLSLIGFACPVEAQPALSLLQLILKLHKEVNDPIVSNNIKYHFDTNLLKRATMFKEYDHVILGIERATKEENNKLLVKGLETFMIHQ